MRVLKIQSNSTSFKSLAASGYPEESTVSYYEEITPSYFFEKLFIVVVSNGKYL